jgi:hypothetical protein
MPELLETDLASATAVIRGVVPPSRGGSTTVREPQERLARRDLRGQIARMEAELGELFASAFPRRGFDWEVAPAGGPRVLGIEELEQVRDSLAVRLQIVRGELAGRAQIEESFRELRERMLAAPEDYRWVRVSRDDVGEPGCGHWHSRPKWGLLGLLMNWWRVRISSGCP